MLSITVETTSMLIVRLTVSSTPPDWSVSVFHFGRVLAVRLTLETAIQSVIAPVVLVQVPHSATPVSQTLLRMQLIMPVYVMTIGHFQIVLYILGTVTQTTFVNPARLTIRSVTTAFRMQWPTLH